jgi:hypothetical protein
LPLSFLLKTGSASPFMRDGRSFISANHTASASHGGQCGNTDRQFNRKTPNLTWTADHLFAEIHPKVIENQTSPSLNPLSLFCLGLVSTRCGWMDGTKSGTVGYTEPKTTDVKKPAIF